MTNVNLIIVNVIGILIVSSIVALFWMLASYSNILRDEIDNTTEFIKNATTRKKYARLATTDPEKIPKPFSLARTQFAAWTLIISCAYCYKYFCCNCQPGFNELALLLLGISAVTGVTSVAIDKCQIEHNAQRLNSGTRPEQSQPSLVRHQNAPSQGFIIDILSDANGISIHRFQSVVWTLISISVYVYMLVAKAEFANCLPELDPTLLSLTGISSAAYVCMKINENKTK